jgi:TonB family protein
MPREPHIPLFLWIATALLVHLTGGEGVQRVSDVLGDRIEVQRFADSVRRHVLDSNRTVEIALLDDAAEPLPSEETPKPPDEPTADENAPPPKDDPSVKDANVQKKKDEPRPKDEIKPVPEKMKPPEPEKPKPPEPKKQDEKKDDGEKKDLPVVRTNNRIAVQQHVEDENQKDNPNAEFIADQANHVREQTRARITATDQNDKDPTPGTSQDGPPDEPGNAHVNDVAHSDDSPGAVDHAPNASAAGQKAAQSAPHDVGGKQQAFREVAPDSSKGSANGEAKGTKHGADTGKPQEEKTAALGRRATEGSPDLATSPAGAETVAEAEQERLAQAGQAAQKKRLPPMRGQPNALDFLGLGASGKTPGGINLNLTPGAALAAVGRDQLGKERIADGERRRSKHRGSWKTLGVEKWRASIENYNASVKPGNQTALNTARVPFAGYLNQIHSRLHPIFADSFLPSLDNLPADHPLNQPTVRTNLEIVLDKDEGKIVKMGVTRSSGSTMFDVAALESVQNAAPFGKPPAIIVSPDGNVYLHWEFYRNPVYACSTYFAHPFMLKASPESAPPRTPPAEPPKFGPGEQPLPARGDLGKLDPTPEPAR